MIRENSRIIVEASGRIGKIVGSLKTFARLDEADCKAVDIHEGIDSALTLLGHELHSRIRLVKDFCSLPKIYCNAAEINQALMSLFTAAIGSIRGQGVLKVATSEDDENVYVKITDTGQGMTKEQVKELFDFGFKTFDSRIGFSMGLPNAYRIIEAHHGDICVNSDQEKGNEFVVRLPVWQLSATAQ